MGMSKTEKQIWAQLQAAIANLSNPKSNPYQEFLGQQAIEGANWLKKGEYGQLPKGMFFNFQQPSEMNEQYKKLANVNQGGTFALAQGNEGGKTSAQSLQGKYLADRFARDASQNYQNNISDASSNIRGALGQAAGATSQNQSAVVNALGSLYQMAPKKTSPWGSILGAGAQIASAFI
jgi:hypothetical protein